MRPVPLPDGWGEAALFEPNETAWTDATRSYDHLGACLAWRVPAGMHGACDMERADKDVGALPAQLGVAEDGFLERWVVAESCAKTLDVPMALWLQQRGLASLTGLGIHCTKADRQVMAFCRKD